MKKLILCLLLTCGAVQLLPAQVSPYRLIAHRGGVVDEGLEENSVQALKAAAKKGYYMVELDVRMTRDSVLVAHHDRDLKRYYGRTERVDELDWAELRKFRSESGNRVNKLDDLLNICRREGLQVMIDWKIRGFDQCLGQRLVESLRRRALLGQALIIPSAEATDFFRGKIKISCTREQVESYRSRSDYDPRHYYLFANPSADDFNWAAREGIMVVGVLNAWTGKDQEHYRQVAAHLKSLGVIYIQLDSQFDGYFF